MYILDTMVGRATTRQGIQAELAQRAEQYRRYTAYLQTIASRIPPAAYQYATAPWRLDGADARSLHDSWIEQVVITEEDARGAEHPDPGAVAECRAHAHHHDSLP